MSTPIRPPGREVTITVQQTGDGWNISADQLDIADVHGGGRQRQLSVIGEMAAALIKWLDPDVALTFKILPRPGGKS